MAVCRSVTASTTSDSRFCQAARIAWRAASMPWAWLASWPYVLASTDRVDTSALMPVIWPWAAWTAALSPSIFWASSAMKVVAAATAGPRNSQARAPMGQAAIVITVPITSATPAAIANPTMAAVSDRMSALSWLIVSLRAAILALSALASLADFVAIVWSWVAMSGILSWNCWIAVIAPETNVVTRLSRPGSMPRSWLSAARAAWLPGSVTSVLHWVSASPSRLTISLL